MFPHANAERCPELLDIGGITGRAGELSIGNLDDPTPSTLLSVTSVDKDDDPKFVSRRKRKHDLSTGSPDNAKATRRFFGTYTGHEEQGKIEETHQGATPTTSDINTQPVRAAGLATDPTKDYIKLGTSCSAHASRKIRNEANHGTYVAHTKKFENWRRKIRELDSDVKFDENNIRRIFHTRCARWLLVKEPGDTTWYKEHLKTCRVTPIPVEGTLMGMGWKLKGKGTKDGTNDKSTMPCRGVTASDNPLVDQYLKRTGASGGGARSIHGISNERFNTEFKYLTGGQREEVYAAQRAERAWRNDHFNLQVHATNCEGFTSSYSLATSLCPCCKSLLGLKAFGVAIHKKMPLDENAKYVNTRYMNTVLVGIYARTKGLKEIIEQRVSLSNFAIFTSTLLTITPS